MVELINFQFVCQESEAAVVKLAKVNKVLGRTGNTGKLLELNAFNIHYASQWSQQLMEVIVLPMLPSTVYIKLHLLLPVIHNCILG